MNKKSILYIGKIQSNEVINGVIEKLSEWEQHPKKNMLTKALACTSFVEPDVSVKGFLKEDILVLTSDGLTNMVKDEEIYNIINSEIETATDRLIDLANKNGGLDNITVIIVQNRSNS